MMKNNITTLEIKNFKSIKDIKIDCKRINVFIGEPNVGKSNILEALSLYVAETCDHNKPLLKDYIRYEKLSNLFYDQDRKSVVSVVSNIGVAYLRYHLNSINAYDIILGGDKNILDVASGKTNLHDTQNDFYKYVFSHTVSAPKPVSPFYHPIYNDNEEFNTHHNPLVRLDYSTPVKNYIFKPDISHSSPYSLFLKPPYGDNLFTILEGNPKLYDEASRFFANYNLDLLIDTESNKLEVQKRLGSRVYKIPYSLAADTLQRIIFHIAAVETNHDSILLLEEPEAHSFPPYISLLSEKIVASKENQFFIATHSPYLLTPFIEQCSHSELAIFVCTYENYETKIKALSKEEVENIMETGIDLFFNIPAFQK